MEQKNLMHNFKRTGQILWVVHLGKRDFSRVWEMQKKLVHLRAKNVIPDVLLLVEHPPVITLGRRAKKEHLLVPPDVLQKEGVGIFEIERGGDITYHGPGQLVGYPIFLLPNGIRDVILFVRSLEEVLILTLRQFGVEGFRRKGFTGVWTSEGKIAAIGIAVKHNVTFHGFALNVSPALEHFHWIVPCGIHNASVTSLKEILGEAPSMEGVKSSVVLAFERVFELQVAHKEVAWLWSRYYQSQGAPIG
ncbi:MAG: lipoyl(octanoyl) transferase LipB [bacterium]